MEFIQLKEKIRVRNPRRLEQLLIFPAGGKLVIPKSKLILR